MTLAQLRKTNPRRLDQVLNASARGYRWSAPVAKHVARAHGIVERRGRFYRSGDPSAPLTHALVALATADHCTAWPAIVEGVALVIQIEIERASDDVLEARRAELVDVEHSLEAAENRATCARDRKACIEAHARKASVHLELMAIYRELVKREEMRG